MAYQELIKSFDRVRSFIRELYIFGFKSRSDFRSISGRSYDDERRRLESMLGDYVSFQRNDEGKITYLSIDSRTSSHNPLYKALKAKSFTDGDITLHFLLLDILHAPDVALSLKEITAAVDELLASVNSEITFDESTVRKKLGEYVREGVVSTEKRGRQLLYRRAKDVSLAHAADAIDYFSEVSPCGVLGSFLLDRLPAADSPFAYKHHCITHALESEILCQLFDAISQQRAVIIENLSRKHDRPLTFTVVPLRIFISAQSGRQHLLAYRADLNRITTYRLDYIISVQSGDVCPDFDVLRARLDAAQAHIWGVNCLEDPRDLRHVSFTVHIGDGEEHIYRRLLREKRCGTVERIDAHTCRFTAEIYDPNEIVPWIRTFICRITELHIGNPLIQAKFYSDLEAMNRMYAEE